MNILHVIRGLANSSGTTHIVGPLAEAQARLGHQVTVYFVEKMGEAPVVPDPQLVQSHCFPMTIRSRHFGWSRQFRSALRDALPRMDIVHIHAIWNFPTWFGMREAFRAGVPYIVAPQGSLETWALGRSHFLKRLYAALTEKPLFDRAARMQALTQTEAEQCAKFGIHAPAAILPNGIDLNFLASAPSGPSLREELQLSAREKIILFLGRLFPKKGLDLLIPAFAKVLETRGDATLVIAGHDAGSDYRSELEQLVQRVGAQKKTHFLGEVRGNRKIQVLRGADLFILPSYSEGLPVAVIEALGSGLPVIITPGCNLPEVVDHEAGWQAQAEVGAISAALLEALESEPERARRGANGRKLVEEQFNWAGIAAQSVRIYEQILAEKGSLKMALP